jgi:SAM-dependent methyltransferase
LVTPRRTPKDAGFVPETASRFWPFVVGTDRAYQPPPRNARLLLWRGLAEALLHIQPTEPRENWRHFSREFLATLMHKEGAGKEHPSRTFVTSLVRPRECVLDVGCGAGAGYESHRAAGLDARYVGVDSSEPSVDVARELYPEGDFRVGNATTLSAQFGPRSFDVVLLRHVLEHMPDFEVPIEQAIAVSRRLAVFVFYLTPRALPFGVRKLDPGHNRPQFFTYIYSRRAIERFLARRGLQWHWQEHLGVSRAGWFANEVNSALVVWRPGQDDPVKDQLSSRS